MNDELRNLLYRPNEDTIFMTDFNEDEVVHVELLGKRRIYNEAAYNKLLAERDRLKEALEFAERRSKQPDEDSNEYYDRLADEFHCRYGYLPPGKDDPLRTVSREQQREEWESFLAEPTLARRKALQEDRE